MPQNKQPKLVRISEKLQQNMQYVDELMGLETNFDIIHRVIRLGDTDACMYLIDGFCKDELMQKMKISSSLTGMLFVYGELFMTIENLTADFLWY